MHLLHVDSGWTRWSISTCGATSKYGHLRKVTNCARQTVADNRGWRNLRLISSADSTYNQDYHAESSAGDQLPALNVFARRDDGIHHFYSTELLYSPAESGQDGRHVDLIWPLWNLFDLTPVGRGKDWYPQLSY